MKIKKKLTRKQFLKQEDEFVSTSAKAILWLKENYNKLILGLIFVVILLIVVFSVRYRSKSITEKSSRNLDMAKNVYYSPVRPPQDPSSPQAQQAFISTEQKYQKALQLFQDLVELYPRSQAAEEARFFIPNCSYFLGKYDDAMKGFKEYMDRYPDGIFVQQAKIGIGFIHEAKGEYAKAIEIFQQMLTENPDYALRDALYMRLGHAYEQTGSTDKAKEAYQNVIINFPDSPFLKEAEEKVDALSGEESQPAGQTE
jgi:TolA-binding protein